MTIPVVPPFDPGGPFDGIPNITPFTHRDGRTYLSELRYLERYIKRDLIPWVQENYDKLAEQFVIEVNKVITEVNTALEGTLEQVTVIVDGFDAHVAQKETEFDNYVATKSGEFDIHVTSKQADFDIHVNTKTGEFDTYVTSKEAEFSAFVEGEKASFFATALYMTDNNDGTITLSYGPPDLTPPSIPTAVDAVATGMTTITVTWAASTDNVAVTGYEYRVNGGDVADVGNVLTANIGGLVPATVYTVDVRAYDENGNRSGWASDTATTAGDTTPPTAGTLASSSVSATAFTLTVSGASDASGLDPNPYRFSTDGGTTYSAWQSSAVYNVTGKAPGTAYSCRHQTKDSAGNIATGTAINVSTAAGILDGFNRADSSVTLGTTQTGETWLPSAGTWGIASNRAKCFTATSNLAATVNAGSADVRVSAAVYLASGTDWFNCGLYARYQDDNNTVYLGIGAGQLELKRKISGTDATIDTVAATIASGDVIGVEVDGTNYAIYRNGVSIKSGTHAALASLTSQRHGLRVGYLTGASVVTWDNFEIVFV